MKKLTLHLTKDEDVLPKNAHLHVSVEQILRMNVEEGTEQLFHHLLDFTERELDIRVAQ